MPGGLVIDQVVEIVLKSLYARNLGLYNHSVKTGKIAHRLVIAGDLWKDFDPQQAHIAGVLHDVGKLFLPDSILLKTGELNASERELMNLHPIWGGQFVQGTTLEPYQEIIMQHHECPSGTGSPFGLRNIGIKARIIQVADCLALLMDDHPDRQVTLNPHFLFQEILKRVDRLFSGEQKRRVLHGVRVILGLAEGKHSRSPLEIVSKRGPQ